MARLDLKSLPSLRPLLPIILTGFIPLVTQACQKHTIASRKVSGVAAAQIESDDDVVSGSIKSFEEIPTPVTTGGVLGGILLAVDAVKKQGFTRPHMYTSRNHAALGPIYRIKLGDGTPFVSLIDPADIEQVYHNSGKYPERIQIEAWKDFRFNNGEELGVLISDGKDWQRHRSALSKRILRPPEIAQYVGVMNEIARCMVENIPSTRLGPEAGDKCNVVLNIEDELDRWAMESACKFLFDRRLNLIAGAEDILPENVDFFNAIRTLTEVTIYLLMLPLKWHRKFQSRPYVRTMKAWEKIFTLSKIYVEEKLSELSKRAVRGEEVNDGSFIAFLMIQDKLKPKEIVSNMTELLTASVDTTSTTSLWCLHLLSKNPRVQEKLHEEVMRVLPKDVNPTREQIDSMTYLKAVVKETLRIYPVTQGTARILPKDLVIRNYHVPAGTAVQTFFYGSGNDPSIFENASEFRPERWLDGSCRHLGFASQPFGFGTRMCLGRRLAEQEMYLILSQISRRFIVKPSKDNIDHVCKVLIVPDQPLELKFIDRT